MPEAPLKLAVLVGSTREGRFADTVARWFVGRARGHPAFVLDVIDLAETSLPVVMPRGADEKVVAFARRLDHADAFVIVTPEYNHSFPASVKHAIDLARSEWHRKPVGFVSYGGISGGLRAVEQLRQVFAELHAVTIRDTVSFHGTRSRFDEAGNPLDPDGPNAAAATLLDELEWWATALRSARAA